MSNWSIRVFRPAATTDDTLEVLDFGDDGDRARLEFERFAAEEAEESVGYELQKDGVYVALWSRSVPVRKETSDG